MKGYDALECTLMSLGYAGKHLGYLSELSFLLKEWHGFFSCSMRITVKAWDYL
jgi:hypothetical protein